MSPVPVKVTDLEYSSRSMRYNRCCHQQIPAREGIEKFCVNRQLRTNILATLPACVTSRLCYTVYQNYQYKIYITSYFLSSINYLLSHNQSYSYQILVVVSSIYMQKLLITAFDVASLWFKVSQRINKSNFLVEVSKISTVTYRRFLNSF